MTETITTWLMAGQLAVLVGTVIAGWGRISASFATVRADIQGLSTRLDRYTDRVDTELNRHWDVITDTTDRVSQLEGWRDARG